jgi:hypothetical protein
MNKTNGARALSVLAIGLALVGCAVPEAAAPPGDGTGTGTGSGSDPNALGQVSLDLAATPAGAQCIRLTITPASGSASVQMVNITASNGSGTPIALTGLPTGPVTISADAYTVACGSISGTPPAWSADPTSVVVRPGLVTSLVLTFKPDNSVSITPNFVGSISSIVAGGYNTYVLTDGAPEGWGVYGVAPGGQSPSRSTTLTNTTTSIALGAYHGCALRNDGTVWCFGYNYYGELGPNIAVGNFTATPVQVPLPGSVNSICAGVYHSCAIINQSSVFCWGQNTQGQLGNNSTTNSATPVQAPTGFVSLRSVSCGGYSTIAVGANGNFYGWGNNNYGQLGDGTFTNRTTPYQNTSEKTVIAAATSESATCDLHADGTVWCWGGNFYGQLGDGTTNGRVTAAKVPLPAAARSIGVGYAHACALLTTGQVQCWGDGMDGEMGDLAGTNRPSPIAVSAFGTESTAVSLAVGSYHNCVVTPLANVWCWGGNYNGGVGDGTYNNAFGPLKVTLQ